VVIGIGRDSLLKGGELADVRGLLGQAQSSPGGNNRRLLLLAGRGCRRRRHGCVEALAAVGQTRGGRYGRFEARIKVPAGQGIWPAFWLLGTNISSVQWPACGEIDIMENIGKEPGTIHGTAHGPGYSAGKGISGPTVLPAGRSFAGDFHTFAVECEPKRITWFLDGHSYFTVTPANLPKNAAWVFDQPKFLLLNLAIGGKWPGNPDSTTRFPQRMIVEYVRVYEK